MTPARRRTAALLALPAAGLLLTGCSFRAPNTAIQPYAPADGLQAELGDLLVRNMLVVSEGDEVEEGQLLCIIEAMKMENEITAHKAGTITDLPISEGAPIKAGDPIATIKSEEAAPAAE